MRFFNPSKLLSFTLLSIASFALISCNRGNSEAIRPTRQSIIESVYASATIVPEFYYRPQATRQGLIEAMLVKEGDLIKKDQLICQIQVPAEVEAKAENATINFKEAEANFIGSNNLLKTMQAEIDVRKERLQLDSLNYFRQKRLWDQKIGTQVALDQATLTYENSQTQLEILKQKHAQTLLALKSNYRRNLNQSDSEKQLLKEYAIRSLIDGRVYQVYKKLGEFVNPREAIVEIGSANNFKIEMDLDEEDILKVNAGDTALVVIDAISDRVLTSIVSRIYPQKDPQSQTFLIEGKFIDPPDKIMAGLAGEANIIVGRRKNALTIPTDYLLDGNKVLTADGEISILLGVKNLDFVEILEGIDSTTLIFRPNKP